MKPILKYRGGKSKELNSIKPFIPKFSGKYIEPFLGGGALFFDLNIKNSIINDINPKLIDFYKDLKNNHVRVRQELKLLQRKYEQNRSEFEKLKIKNPNEKVKDLNEDLYYEIRDMFNSKIDKFYSEATIYFFINKVAYSGMIRYNAQGEFNVPYGRYKNFNTELITDEHVNLLSDTEIYCLDYSDIFNIAKSNDFIFLDPPYDCVFSDYGNLNMDKGFTESMHIKLASDFKNLNCKALMVIGKTDLTKGLYEKYIIHEYEKSYAVNIKNRFKSESKHILISNFGK